MSNITPKRFIAGAVCPACNAQDSIKMWNVDGVPHRECVACGYTDILNEQGLSVPQEPATRVTPTAAPESPKSQTLQFVPNPKLKKKEAH